MSNVSEPQLKITLEQARSDLAAARDTWIELLTYGDGSVGLYAPKGEDTQEPHDQDEVYLISGGTGKFRRGDTVVPFVTGDVLFVPANVPHRFEDFTDHFETWVVFFGPKGGSKPVK